MLTIDENTPSDMLSYTLGFASTALAMLAIGVFVNAVARSMAAAESNLPESLFQEEEKPAVAPQAKQDFESIVNKIATIKQDITNKKHLAALDKLVNELTSASEAYSAEAQTPETFAKFETQCKQAISDSKVVLGQEFGFWNSIMLPLLNGIIKALDIIGKAVCLVPKKHSPAFFKPVETQAMFSFNAMKIESDVEDELISARPAA